MDIGSRILETLAEQEQPVEEDAPAFTACPECGADTYTETRSGHWCRSCGAYEEDSA